MMSCGEADSEGEDGFLAALQRDDALVADILIRLSLSEPYVPSRQPPAPTRQPPQQPPPSSSEMKWGRKGSRSRCITMEGIRAAEAEDAGRGSPTTPLSWAGGASGSSGSGSSGSKKQGRGAPRAKRRRTEAPQEGGPALAPPTDCPEMASVSDDRETREDSAATVPPTFVSSSTTTSPGSDPEAAELPAVVRDPSSSTPVARVEPLRLRLTAEGVISVAVSRPGKKKTFAQLQSTRDSLLQEQEGLREELDRQKRVYGCLIEQNLRLKEVQSSLLSHTMSRPTPTPAVCEEPKLEHHSQHVPSLPESQTVEAPRTASVATPEEELRVLEQPSQHVPSLPESETVEGPCTASVAPEEESQVEERPEGSCCKRSSLSATGRTLLFDLNCPPDEWC